MSNEASATPATVPMAPTNVTAIAGNKSVTITFMEPVSDGGSAITGYEVFNSEGELVAIGVGESNSISITDLANGTTYSFTVKSKNIMGSSVKSEHSNFVTPRAPSSNDNDDNSSPSRPKPTAPEPINTGVDIIVNGKVERTGIATTNEENGQRVTTITVDEDKLQQRLESERERVVITIPFITGSDVAVGELNGRMIKNMENQQAVLEVRTDKAIYTMLAEQINIDRISERFGAELGLQDIKVKIEVAVSPTEMVRVVENAANREDLTLIVPPLNFKVSVVYGDRTEEISKFSSYVARTVAIPEGVDPNRITTGIVVEPDGTVRHVPTRITIIDGKYYAVINSLTNSTYSVVWNPMEFNDATNHWAKEAINDMGSRMVIDGVGNNLYEPDREITRSEFTAIIVRALGLKPGTGSNPFTDVSTTDWYYEYIQTASEYDIISGYGNGKFGPMNRITREQAMVMIARAMTITGIEVELTADDIDALLAGFGDSAQVAAYAKESIWVCVKAEIVSGKNGKLLAPKDEITRAEVAVIVQRLLKKSNLI